MDLTRLNPVVRSASVYERIGKSDECIAYDSKIIYVISGDLSVTVDKKRLGHLSPGQLIYIPAGTAYKLKAKFFRGAVICFDLTDDNPLPEERMPPVAIEDFKAELCHSASLFPPFDKPIHVEDMESDRETFIRMGNIFTSAEGLYRAQLSAMLKPVLVKLAELSDEHALPSRMVEALDNYIRENVSDEISNTEIGAIFGYHPFYVSKMLKDKKGITLRQYIISYRLKAAARMLELTEKSVAEIAEECGFTDSSYFTKTFKAAYGETPKTYRNKFKDDYV